GLLQRSGTWLERATSCALCGAIALAAGIAAAPDSPCCMPALGSSLLAVALAWLCGRRLSAWPVVPCLWLALNCLMAAFWTEIPFPAMQFPPAPHSLLLDVAWLLLLVSVAWLALRRRSWRRRVVSTVLVGTGLLIAWNGPWLGHCSRILRNERHLLQAIATAM